jgi:hypothetical protein
LSLAGLTTGQYNSLQSSLLAGSLPAVISFRQAGTELVYPEVAE